MKFYEKPLMTVESLEADVQLANDSANLGELDPLNGSNGNEVSIPAPDDWFDY